LKQNVLVVTGCVGVGKTTVSKIVANKVGATHLDLSDICLKKGFIKGYDRERKTPIVNVPPLRAYVRKIAKQAALLILDGHYASDVSPKPLTKTVIVLRCHPLQLKERLMRKGYGKRKLNENVLSETLDVCLHDALSKFDENVIHEIDTTDRSAEDVANDVLAVLKGKKRFRIGKVDWLSRLEKEGTLVEVLSMG
jgi:adenylate kinase